MRYSFYFFGLIFLIVACSEEDPMTTNNDLIIGKWNLTENGNPDLLYIQHSLEFFENNEYTVCVLDLPCVQGMSWKWSNAEQTEYIICDSVQNCTSMEILNLSQSKLNLISDGNVFGYERAD